MIAVNLATAAAVTDAMDLAIAATVTNAVAVNLATFAAVSDAMAVTLTIIFEQIVPVKNE
jgi:hypothetical protein